MKAPIKKMVIVGGGIIAWWASVFLKKTNPHLEVVLVNAGEVAEYATSVDEDFFYLLRLVGLSAKDLVTNADGNFFTSQAFFEWATNVDNYFHSSFVADMDYDISPYNQWLLKLKLSGEAINIDDYLLASAAARQGKVALSKNQNLINASLNVDSAKFLNLLKSYALQLGVQIVVGELLNVCLREGGGVQSIELKNGEHIQGDFFIDVTGEKSELLGAAVKVPYESWSKHLPLNRKKVISTPPRSDRLIPFVAIQHTDIGWIKNIPLRSRFIAELSFSDDIAVDESHNIARMFSAAETHPFSPGMRKSTWVKNCLGLGASAVVFDSFSHSPLSVASITLQRFSEFWVRATADDLVADEFNRLMRIEYEAIRDFHCLHYFLAKKSDSSMGELLRNIHLPDSLEYRVNLFGDTGNIDTDESTLIHPTQWKNLFLGFGYWPKHYNYVLNHVPTQELVAWSKKVKADLDLSVSSAPEYNAYMAKLMS